MKIKVLTITYIISLLIDIILYYLWISNATSIISKIYFACAVVCFILLFLDEFIEINLLKIKYDYENFENHTLILFVGAYFPLLNIVLAIALFCSIISSLMTYIKNNSDDNISYKL